MYNIDCVHSPKKVDILDWKDNNPQPMSVWFCIWFFNINLFWEIYNNLILIQDLLNYKVRKLDVSKSLSTTNQPPSRMVGFFQNQKIHFGMWGEKTSFFVFRILHWVLPCVKRNGPKLYTRDPPSSQLWKCILGCSTWLSFYFSLLLYICILYSPREANLFKVTI